VVMLLKCFYIFIALMLTVTPVRITVYQLTVLQCDEDPTTGAFGKMGRYPRECALTNKAAHELRAEPGDLLFIWPGDWELAGFYHYWDHMPGKRAKIDLQVDGNYSGKGWAINLDFCGKAW